MEKRRVSRTIKRLEINFSSGDLSYTGISSNMSELGIFVRTKQSFNPGTKLELKIYLPTGKALIIHGIVKWALKTNLPHLKNGMGIDILDASREYKDFLKSLE